MTARLFSRLIIGIGTMTLIVVLLFSGSTTDAAGKGDRSAPTVPSNLTVTAVTDTTVSLSWQGSTDNSGKFSYRVNIKNLNSAYLQLATVSQTQTTYTAKFLNPNSSFSFSVYAVDGNGNRSADSNTVGANTLPDSTPPSSPVLQATVLGPSQVQLTWTESQDNALFNCCNYTINLNGNPLTGPMNWATAASGQLSVIVRHLTPGSANSFSVSAFEWSGGHVATSNAVNTVLPPSNDTLPPTVPTNLHLVRDTGCGEVWIGWTEASDNSDTQAVIEYEIYVNGVLSPLPISAGIDFDFVYATAFGDNVFTVKAVDRSGNTSAASAALKLFVWPC